MFKNMKVGMKIGLGFAIVLFITLALSATVITTNLMSAEDLDAIDTMAEFELNAGEFSGSFVDARMRATTVFQSTNTAEYNRATESYNRAHAALEALTRTAQNESGLNQYADVLQTLTVSLDDWKSNLDELHRVNQTLDKMRDVFETQVTQLSLNIYSLYMAQFDALYQEIRNERGQTRIMAALRKAQSSGELVTGVHTVRREFVQLSDFFIVDGVPDALRQIAGLRNTLQGYSINTENEEEATLSAASLELLNEYERQATDITNLVTNRNALLDETLVLAEELSAQINTLTSEVSAMSRAALTDAHNMGALAQLLAVILSAAAVVIGLLTAVFIVRGITKPVEEMTAAARMLREGVLDTEGMNYRSKDEIGQLSHNMRHMAKEIQQVIEDMHAVNRAQEQGDWDARVDESKFRGAYRELASSSNALTEGYMQDMLTVTRCLESFSQGDFMVQIAPMPGKKAVINETVDAFKNNMQGVQEQISKLTQAANQGNLSVRAAAADYQGGWAEILVQLNTLLRSIIGPVNEASQVLQQIAGGHFRQLVSGDYKGDFLVLKNTVNGMADNISGYIYEISHILSEVNDNNLDQEITREYLGDFAHIKTAINEIIQKFNTVISDIYSAADAVTLGAKSISDTSMRMAQGASEQAASVRILSETVQEVSRGTQRNAQEAGRADNISGAAREKADRGNREMSEMLLSMEGIKDSSNNISKIISAIDDIASQTNMLALNAAVEAARAGENGKGFAVVAEEVGGLATNSQQNAQQTTLLVKESIDKISEGQSIAKGTAKSLREIVDDVNMVAEIITDIAQGSRKQADAIEQISGIIAQISNVVNQNSATSEEAAAASQQLSSQADVMRGLMEVFTLRQSTEDAASPASGNAL